jgi:hypothetical protein
MTLAGKIQRLVELDKMIQEQKREYDALLSEVEGEALNMMGGRDLSSAAIYGPSGSSVVVTDAVKVTVQNPVRLREVITPPLFDAHVTVEQPVSKYKVAARLEQAIAAVMSGDYEPHRSIEAIVSELNIDAKQQKLLLKKLKGDYRKDRKLMDSLGDVGCDIDTFLMSVHRAAAWENICLFFDPSSVAAMAEQLKTCITFEDVVRAELRYEKELEAPV